MADLATVLPGVAQYRVKTVVARADGSPITSGTVNYYLKALTGTNAGKWWDGNTSTWAAVETANAMTHQADGNWSLQVAAGAWVDGDEYLEYVKESGDLHIPDGLHLVCRDAAEAGDAMDLIASVKGSGFDSSTDSLEAIRNNMVNPAELLARMTGSILKSSNRELKMVSGDTKPDVQVIVTDDDGSAVDITGATIYVRFYEKDSKSLLLTKSTTGGEVTITDGANGTFEWTWTATDWNSLTRTGEDIYEIEVEIIYSGGGKQSVYEFYDLTVREKRNTS